MCCTGRGCPSHVCRLDGGAPIQRLDGTSWCKHLNCNDYDIRPDGTFRNPSCWYEASPPDPADTCARCDGTVVNPEPPQPPAQCYYVEEGCDWVSERVHCIHPELGYPTMCNEDVWRCNFKGWRCKETKSCVPDACPEGSSETGLGPLVTTRTCYQTIKGAKCTKKNGEDVCVQEPNIRRCYRTFTLPPVVTETEITDTPSTTALGCFAQGLTGKEVNNDLKISLNVQDPDGAEEARGFAVWMTDEETAPVISALSTSSSLLQNNDSFGFMVAQYNGEWRVFTPRYSNSAWSWVNAGGIGTGERARINGREGKTIVILKDISTSTVSEDTINLKATIEFVHDGSGLSDFETLDANTYKVFTAGTDESRFFQNTSSTTMPEAPQFTYVRDWTVDLHPPIAEELSHTVISADRFNFNWNFSDFIGIKRVVGNARATEGGEVRGPIDDITSGVLSYEIGSAPTGTELYNGNSLWKLDSNTRSELIDMKDNEGNAFEFVINAFDNACNAGEHIYNLNLGSPWIITKGGIVFSSGGANITVQNVEGNEPFSQDSYWTGAFRFLKDEADLSSEILTGGSSNLPTLINGAKLGSVRVTQYSDMNNRSNYWYGELSRRFTHRSLVNPEEYTILTFPSNTVLSEKTSNIVSGSDGEIGCNEDTTCVVTVEGNLTINENYLCDTRTAFLVNGNITVNPNVIASNTASGCIFVSSNDITIADGQYHSSGSTYPKYDVVDGYFIADGNINIPEGDKDKDVRDGLIVRGGLVSFGTEGNKSISFGRSLKLVDNNAFPTLAVHADNRYLNFAAKVFGGHHETFKREVGFKPL